MFQNISEDAWERIWGWKLPVSCILPTCKFIEGFTFTGMCWVSNLHFKGLSKDRIKFNICCWMRIVRFGLRANVRDTIFRWYVNAAYRPWIFLTPFENITKTVWIVYTYWNMSSCMMRNHYICQLFLWKLSVRISILLFEGLCEY